MKSLLITHFYFPPRKGGISHLMAGLASALGPDRVCCLTGVPAQNGAVNDSLQLRVYRRPTAFAEPKWLRALGWGTSIAQIILREHVKVVQVASVGEINLGLWLRRWCKLPFVVYAHGNDVLWAMRSPGLRLALQQADRVLANSRFTANLVQRAGVDLDRIETVYPGCDSNCFQPRQSRMELREKLLGPRYGGRVILSVGALVVRKGQDMVIRALPRVRESIPEVKYLIVGGGRYRPQLESLAEAMGVRDHVIFARQVPTEELADIYALSDVFVMPSRERLEANDVEGFGMVFLEASACAKPVIGGRSGGIPDAIVDGVTGLLVDPHDPEDIANALVRLLTDRDLAIRLGQQGRTRVVHDFDWARAANQVQSVLNSIVGKKSTHN
jgi:phosphatidyl-myo-inositol dimannoside synthase